MNKILRQFSGFTGLVAVAMLFFAAPAQATMLDVRFVGTIDDNGSGFCSDAGEKIDDSFSVDSDSSDGYINVDLGGDNGTIMVEVSQSEVEALIQAVSAAGGTLTVPVTDEPIESKSDCNLDGTLTLKVQGGNGNVVDQNAPGSIVESLAGLSDFGRKLGSAFQNRISGQLQGRNDSVSAQGGFYSISTGMAAGEEGGRPPISAWAGFSYTDSKNDFSTTAFTSDRYHALLGLDYMPADDWLLGVAFSFERSETDTRFNGGEVNTTGISVSPYFGFLLNDWLSVDAAVGVSSLSTDQYRTSGTSLVTSDVDSFRIYGTMNLTATQAFDKVLASGYAGMLYATQSDDDYLESDGRTVNDVRNSIGRFLLGGELAYSAGAWEPYVSGTFEYDFTRSDLNYGAGVLQPEYDATDVLFAVGLRYFSKDNVSGAVEYSTVLGRQDLNEHSVSANLRWQF